MEAVNAILSRRSVRKFLPEEIAQGDLEQILEAGLWAPSAGSRQNSILLVLRGPAQTEALGRLNRSLFGAARSTETSYVSKVQVSIADDDSIQSGFYGAPVVIALFSPKDARYGISDCSVVVQNMSLAAWSLGIGSCFIGRAEETFETREGKTLMEQAGIPPDHAARAFLCLGYPNGEPGEGKPRKQERIFYVN